MKKDKAKSFPSNSSNKRKCRKETGSGNTFSPEFKKFKQMNNKKKSTMF